MPDESNFETNTSMPPFEVRLAVPAPGSKSTVPEKDPAVYTLPDESTATERASSSPVLPNTATAPSPDDHAPAGDPDTPTSVDTTSTAVTAVRSRRRVAPGAGSERAVTR